LARAPRGRLSGVAAAAKKQRALPKGWEDMPARLANAELTDPAAIAAQVTPAIAETVRKQVEAGIDCIGDGEF